MTPRSGLCGATASAIRASRRRGTSTIGRCGPASSSSRRVVDVGDSACAVGRSGTMTANGLSPRRFRRRSSATARSLSASQARWYPPMPLTASTPPSRSSCRARGSAIVAVDQAAVAVAVAQRRPAVRAADGLGVEAPVGGIGVFARAFGAHLERRHRGGGAVVGQGGDDREPRAAVGAVDERVAVAPVGRVALFGRALARTWRRRGRPACGRRRTVTCRRSRSRCRRPTGFPASQSIR